MSNTTYRNRGRASSRPRLTTKRSGYYARGNTAAPPPARTPEQYATAVARFENGSPDGTPSYLAAVTARAERAKAKVTGRRRERRARNRTPIEE